MMAGRPLRFLAITGGGWITLRVAMLWPAIDPGPALIHAVVPAALAKRDPALAGPMMVRRKSVAMPHSPVTDRSPAARKPRFVEPEASLVTNDHVAPEIGAVPSATTRLPKLPPPLRPTPFPTHASRFSASAWLIARGGSNRASLGSQLGASQAGVRALYALDDARHLSLAARIATPLQGRGREAAIGVEWRPGRLPVRLIAEQRFAIDGGRGGPALLAVGGIGPTRVASKFDLEAYGQAGGVVRDRIEGFADGAARVTRPVSRIGAITLDLGAGAWGGIQRDAGRLDVGPTIGARIPVAGRAVRVTLDWRARVAGNARPGSGPALSVGTDF